MEFGDMVFCKGLASSPERAWEDFGMYMRMDNHDPGYKFYLPFGQINAFTDEVEMYDALNPTTSRWPVPLGKKQWKKLGPHLHKIIVLILTNMPKRDS